MSTQVVQHHPTLCLGLAPWKGRVLAVVSAVSAGGAVWIGLWASLRFYENLPLALPLVVLLALHFAADVPLRSTQRRLSSLAWEYIKGGILAGAINPEVLRQRSLVTAADRSKMARILLLDLLWATGMVFLILWGQRSRPPRAFWHVDGGASLVLAAAVGALGLQAIMFSVRIIGMNRRIRDSERRGAQSPVVVEELTPLTGCPRCALDDHGTAPRPDGVRHRPTRPSPSLRRLQASLLESIVEGTDGCEVEPDGACKHGHHSWLRALGIA